MKNITANILDEICHADSIFKMRDGSGNFKFLQGYFYRHSNDEDKFANKIKSQLESRGYKVDIIETGDHWASFRGNASVKQSSHFWVIMKISVDLLEKQAIIDPNTNQKQKHQPVNIKKEVDLLEKQAIIDPNTNQKEKNQMNNIKSKIRKGSKVTANSIDKASIFGIVERVSGEQIIVNVNGVSVTAHKSSATILNATQFSEMQSAPIVDKKESKVNKKESAKSIFLNMVGQKRKVVIAAFMSEVGLSKAGAATYYQNFKSGPWANATA